MIERTIGWYYKVAGGLAFGHSQKGTGETYADAGWCSACGSINLFTTKEDAVITYRRRCQNERSFCKQGAKLVRVVRKCPQPKTGTVFEYLEEGDSEWHRCLITSVYKTGDVDYIHLPDATYWGTFTEWEKNWKQGNIRILSVPREV